MEFHIPINSSVASKLRIYHVYGGCKGLSLTQRQCLRTPRCSHVDSWGALSGPYANPYLILHQQGNKGPDIRSLRTNM